MSLANKEDLRDANSVTVQVGSTVENGSTVGYIAAARWNGAMQGLFQPHGASLEPAWVAGRAILLHNPIPAILAGVLMEGWEE